MSNDLNFRIHPAIGIARVGNSKEYYLAPETAAGDTSGPISGGLPIKAGTESTTITSSDLRDSTTDPNDPNNSHKFRRQAARFKIYQYTSQTGNEKYPLGPDAVKQEVQIGSTVNGQLVTDIIWTVHLANKKAQFYQAETNGESSASFEPPKLPPLRNSNYPPAGVTATRMQALVVDPGPRTVSGKNTAAVAFDKNTIASYYNSKTNTVSQIHNYPKSFPGDYFEVVSPQGPIDTLGEIQTDAQGRLIVAGGYGKSAQWGNQPLTGAIDNDGWFDDASDGPVSAIIVLSDGSKLPIQGSAWVAVTDPSYAPQIKNVVSLWEDMYDVWVRNLRLIPDLNDGTSFNNNYIPGFDNQVSGVFEASELQQWIANLPSDPHSGHPATFDGGTTENFFYKMLRDPNQKLNDIYMSPNGYVPYMPLCLGDTGESFLSVTKTQYFFLTQWTQKKCTATSSPLGPGELLDQNTLLNCLGGRFSPGIDLTWIVRDSNLYVQTWETSGSGPFRINSDQLDYGTITPGKAFLSEGYVPFRTAAVQPGDVIKLMALPWHADYNSCANHQPETKATYPTAPPTSGPSSWDDYSFWSWPAQRPVAAFTSTKPKASKEQWFTLRGAGTDPATDPSKPKNVGPHYLYVCRYQTIEDILTNWQKIGVIMQSTVIDDVASGYDASDYLETQSQFPDGEPVASWPDYLPESGS